MGFHVPYRVRHLPPERIDQTWWFVRYMLSGVFIAILGSALGLLLFLLNAVI